MKRALIAIAVLVVLVAGSLVAVDRWPADAGAQDERVIRVTTSFNITELLGATDYEIDDPCSFGDGVSDPDLLAYGARLQLIVRDQNGAIVAMQTVEGNVEAGILETDPDLYCQTDHRLIVPTDAAYYTLHLGETFIQGYATTDFPLAPEESILISLD